jgi:hypothetical protein
MKVQQSHGVLQMDQQLLSRRSKAEQAKKRTRLLNRGIRLGKTICVAVAVLLVGGLANFAAFGSIIRFEYDFTSETGSVSSQDPFPEGTSFSGLTLNNVVKGGPSPVGGTFFGPWDPLLDHYISFTIFAPSGYQLDVTSLGAFVSTGAIGVFELSGPGTSEEIKMRLSKSAGIRDPRPLFSLTGELTFSQISAVPESGSTILFGGISAAGLILVSLLWRPRGGGPLGVFE